MESKENSTSPPAGAAAARTGSSLWNQIVRALESDNAGALSSPPDAGDRNNLPEVESSGTGGNAGGKKPAWNKKPPNGPVSSGPVLIGPAEAWPALSESTKVLPKNLADFGSASPPQVIIAASPSSSSSWPVQSLSQSSPTSQKPTTSNSNHNPTPSHGRPTRQKSMKSDGGASAQANGGFPYQQAPAGEGSHSHNHNGRDNLQNYGQSGSRNVNGDHSQPRSSYRRGNWSQQNHGGRRGDNHQRSYNGRGAPIHSRFVPRGMVRPPPPPPPIVYYPPVRPFMPPIGGMPDAYMFYPGMPFVQPLPPVNYFPPLDPQLQAKVATQIDYYFSTENLIRDIFLRKNMDENGWVPVTLVAGFKKIMQLTDDIHLILNAVRSFSTHVEVQGNYLRKRDDYKDWIISPSMQFPISSRSQSPGSPAVSTLTARIQSVTVDEKTVDHNNPNGAEDANGAGTSRSSSGEMNIPSQTGEDGASSSGC